MNGRRIAIDLLNKFDIAYNRLRQGKERFIYLFPPAAAAAWLGGDLTYVSKNHETKQSRKLHTSRIIQLPRSQLYPSTIRRQGKFRLQYGSSLSVSPRAGCRMAVDCIHAARCSWRTICLLQALECRENVPEHICSAREICTLIYEYILL